MADYRNRTFTEINVGESATVTRTLTAADVEALALAAGDVEAFHLEDAGGSTGAATGPRAQGAAAVALVAGLLSRRLPGPGSAIVSTRFSYAGSVHVVDTLHVSVCAQAKHTESNRVDFACHCVNQSGDVLVDGMATVAAPIDRIAYGNLATPELILRRNDGFVKLLEACKDLPAVSCAVVHPCDRNSLLGAIEAAQHGIITPILVGPEAKIRAVATMEQVDLAPYRIVSTEHSHAAADQAVAMARAGEVEG